MTGKAIVPGQPSTGYQAGLARNACHFAPQSWHAWADYHKKALELARIAYQRRDEDDAQEKAGETLIQNGFGDHFLQDSFAAGHLIDKTLIMQWFIERLDAHPLKSDMTTDANWRSAQAMAYGQPGLSGRDKYRTPVGQGKASDPRSAENTAGDWTDRFSAAGLQVPSWAGDAGSPTYQVFSWWQQGVADGKVSRELDIRDLKAKSPIQDENVLKEVLRDLHDRSGVVHYAIYGSGDRLAGVDKVGFYNFLGVAKNFKIRDVFVPRSKRRLAGGSYRRMAAAVAHKDYTTFLDNSYLQLATNVLHDDFCKNGLTVADASGRHRFRVYGDNNMLQEGSADGVRWSAETSRMSRDPIYSVIETGKEPPDMTTEKIAEMLPRRATFVKGGTPRDLGAWHGEGGQLWSYCNEKSFPEAAALLSKGTLTGATTMGTISQDNPHPTEGF